MESSAGNVNAVDKDDDSVDYSMMTTLLIIFISQPCEYTRTYDTATLVAFSHV